MNRPTRTEPEKTPTFTFRDLENLRLLLREVLPDQKKSIDYFKHDVGFEHYKGKKPSKISVSSSATCVLSLVATNSWRHTEEQSRQLVNELIKKSTSAGLPKRNAFTIAWILEAVTVLEPYAGPLGAPGIEVVSKIENTLENAIRRGKGGVKIEDYPSSAYLTQLVVRVLARRSRLTDDLRDIVSKWAWAELARQLVLVEARSKTADAFAVAYLVMLVTAATPVSLVTPEQLSTKKRALKTFFDCQLDDGTWPLSRPLFHYRKFGNAYCYEYEMLTQLLRQNELQDLLLEHLSALAAAARSAVDNAYHLEDGVQVWTSGHHPQQANPESWSTASVYHFAHELDRLSAEAVRRELFRYLDLPSPPPARANVGVDFAPRFLDSSLSFDDRQVSLKDYLLDNFVKPLASEAGNVGAGQSLKKGTPRSAIFFGPPGTSKTELSKEIAAFIGWPLVSVDPSNLLRNGMDGIQAEANMIFRMLAETERVVVLFDEFDEFVRERDSSDAEQFSRLLTTAMLPKLADVHKRGTLVFIIATNNIQQFDIAIRRPGRFDHVVQIMPPIYREKMAKTNWGTNENVDVAQKLGDLGVTVDEQNEGRLGDLTYLEFDAFATELARAKSPQDALSALDRAWKNCILSAKTLDGKETWKQRCSNERHFNR
jgi:hypothetical protein